MRITFVCPAFDMCGGQRVVALYGSRLRAKGHEVVVVGLPPRPHSLRERLRALRRGDRIRWREPMGPSHFDPYPGLARRIDRFRPITARDVPDADVVVATWWETAEWAADLPPEKGAKVYFIQHHETFPYLPIDRVEATLARPDFHKIAVAPWLVDLLRDRYGDPNAKLVLNGVDVNHFRAPARAKNAIPTVGLMYTETSFKGTEIALKAYDLASRRVPGLRLATFGSRRPSPGADVPAGMDFTLLPPQDQIPRIYARCDAWLFSSRSEGFGLPILESMACGTPVIGTPAGAAPALIGKGGGVLVPMDDPEAMADAIVKVVGLTDSEWKAMSDAALATARRNTWESSIDEFEAALEAAAQDGDGRVPPPLRANDPAPAAAASRGLELVGAND
jgi:glycosyltransferase involved in cell wall biosynthesis